MNQIYYEFCLSPEHLPKYFCYRVAYKVFVKGEITDLDSWHFIIMN